MKRDGRTEVVWRARGSKQGEDTRRNLDNNGGCSLWGRRSRGDEKEVEQEAKLAKEHL